MTFNRQTSIIHSPKEQITPHTETTPSGDLNVGLNRQKKKTRKSTTLKRGSPGSVYVIAVYGRVKRYGPNQMENKVSGFPGKGFA